MNCMQELVYGLHLYTCNDCPLKKYNCCGTTTKDVMDLYYTLANDIVKLEILKEKVFNSLKK